MSEPSTKFLIERLWRDHLAIYKVKTLLAILALAIVAGLHATQIYLIAPAIDEGLIALNKQVIFWICGIVLIVSLAKGAADYTQILLLTRIGTDLIAKLQARMMQSAIHADIPQIHGEGSGRFVARFLSDSYVVRDATMRSLIGIARDFLSLLGMIGLMLSISIEMTIAVFIIFPVSFMPIIWIGRKSRALSHRLQNNLGSMTGLLDDFFKSIRIVKAFVAEPLAMRQAHALFEHQSQLQYKMDEVRARIRPIMELLGAVAVIAIILLGGWRVSEGHNTPGEIMAFIAALMAAVQPLRSLANLNAALQQGLAAANRCFNMIDLKPFVKEAVNPLNFPQQTNLALKQVHFGYTEEQAALKNISLNIGQGEVVALVGPSGSGKSTLMNLILRLYDPNQGEVLLGGVNLRDLSLGDVRAHIALVSQEPGILDDTVAHNIALKDSGDDWKYADHERIIEAAKAAEAHTFIEALPQGYDTRLGEMGSTLSGGQRQRLAIARALYKDAPILLLDEATSSLDSETERAVQTALKRLMKGRTVIVIAHRLSTILDADRIVVLNDGQLIESGTHAELLEKSGLYSQLYHLQFGE